MTTDIFLSCSIASDMLSSSKGQRLLLMFCNNSFILANRLFLFVKTLPSLSESVRRVANTANRQRRSVFSG